MGVARSALCGVLSPCAPFDETRIDLQGPTEDELLALVGPDKQIQTDRVVLELLHMRNCPKLDRLGSEADPLVVAWVSSRAGFERCTKRIFPFRKVR